MCFQFELNQHTVFIRKQFMGILVLDFPKFRKPLARFQIRDF